MNYGIDYLAGATYKDLILKNHPKGWCAGFFLNTFGNAWQTIKPLLKLGTCPAIRVHAVWDDLHRYNPTKHDAIIKDELKKCVSVACKFPKVHFYFSPFCEHNIKGDELVRIFKYCKNIAKGSENISFVNCVWQGDFIYNDKQVLNEIHGTHAQPAKGHYLFSFDGLDAYNVDIESYKKKHIERAEIFYLWTLALNLKRNEKEKLTVAQRIERDFRPKSVHINALKVFKNPKGETNVPKNWIIKPMSEDCGDVKSNKLLVMLPEKADKIELVPINDKYAFMTLNRFDPAHNGLNRYYALKAGVQVRNQDIKKTGYELLRIRVNNKIQKYNNKDILINPAFRDGAFKG